jgi:hypothetical protein
MLDCATCGNFLLSPQDPYLVYIRFHMMAGRTGKGLLVLAGAFRYLLFLLISSKADTLVGIICRKKRYCS